MAEARIIKRYANRKLYDTQHSRYVTLEQISTKVLKAPIGSDKCTSCVAGQFGAHPPGLP